MTKKKATAKYLEDYEKYIFCSENAEMSPLTGEELQQAAKDATESAAGDDQWGPGDRKNSHFLHLTA